MVSGRTPVVTLLVASLVGGYACATHSTHKGTQRSDRSEPPDKLPSVTVVVSPADEKSPMVFVDEEYLDELSAAIREDWHGRHLQLSRPITLQLELRWDGRLESFAFRAPSGDSQLDNAALTTVVTAHARTVMRQFRLYTQDNGVKRRCLSCIASVLVTLSAAAN